MELKFSAPKDLESKILEHLKIQGLICTDIGLKDNPNAAHHHIRNITNDPGILELTVLPTEGSDSADFILEMREDRMADWGSETVTALAKKFEIGVTA